MERELERGPLARRWTDQRWTLARIKTRIKTRIGRLFPVSYTVEEGDLAAGKSTAGHGRRDEGAGDGPGPREGDTRKPRRAAAVVAAAARHGRTVRSPRW
uniref:hypothetical protein n=1 Tax=Streptomyces spongiae TaxID=565072 RepID=UPI001D14837C|nr:hypothetical protein [Streptomyces spongiae]